jgi:predicted  nucleic acid-binding Zn-ribbon protein
MSDQYDPNVAEDHTGMMFKATERPRAEDVLALMHKPTLHACPHCGTRAFLVFADDHPTSSLMVLMCRKCKAATRPMELRLPQMTDRIAKKMGLWVPDQAVIETEMEVERG